MATIFGLLRVTADLGRHGETCLVVAAVDEKSGTGARKARRGAMVGGQGRRREETRERDRASEVRSGS